MDVMNIIWVAIALVMMFLGLAGTLIHLVPGTPLIYAGYLFYGFASGWKYYGIAAMILWGVVTGLTVLLDFYVGAIGAKKYGGTRWGIIGSIVVGIIGLVFFSFPGLIIGTFAGAVAGELVTGRPHAQAFKAGWGALVGFLAGVLVKIVVGIIMIGTFIIWVFF